MNSDYQIYSALKDEIPAEDKARLDGYLHARSEVDEKSALEDQLAQMRAELDRRASG